MPLTKAEMESHSQSYHSCVNAARVALHSRQHRHAVELAVSGWQFVDGMMQFAKRYENKQFDRLEAFDIVLTFAPLLFDSTKLDALEALLKSKRRIDRNTAVDEPQLIADARATMSNARRAWNLIEKHQPLKQEDLCKHLGGDKNTWVSIVAIWAEMGIVNLRPEAGDTVLSMVTRMDDVARAKCSKCAAVFRGPKSKLLAASHCPACKTAQPSVLLGA